MRETVCIVLNEREANKRKAAEALEEELRAINITPSRIEIEENIEELVLQTSPRVLVLDYLLGDYSTGLDILAQFEEIDEAQRPAVIFLTDEPSVSVAVEAMRLGAQEYIELDNPRAIPSVVGKIRSLLSFSPLPPLPRGPRQPRLNDLIAHAPKTRNMIEQAALAVKTKSPIVVLLGERGIGKRAVARAMLLEQGVLSMTREIDFQIDDTPVRKLIREEYALQTTRQLGRNLSLLAIHAEDAESEFLEIVSEKRELLWPEETTSPQGSFLYLCTADPETASLWERVARAVKIEIPPLSERSDDLAPLIHHFTAEGSQLTGEKIKTPDSDTIQWLTTLDWPGNLIQLRSVVVNALLMEKFGDRDFRTRVDDLRSSWEESIQETNGGRFIDSLAAAQVLEAASGNFRIAAARIGCSPKTLRVILENGSASSGASDHPRIEEGS